MLECVLDEDNRQQRWHLCILGQGALNIKLHIHIRRITNTHQLNVIFRELHLLLKVGLLLLRVVEHIAHHLREFDYDLLGRLGVNINHRMDVIERIHEEVGIDLILQIIHLRLQCVTLHGHHLLLGLNRAKDKFNRAVGTHHKQSEQHIPVPRQIGERCSSVNIVICTVGILQHSNLILIQFERIKYGRQHHNRNTDICQITVLKKETWRKQRVINNKDDDIGKQLTPYEQDITQIDVLLRHHLRVEDRHQQCHSPYQ